MRLVKRAENWERSYQAFQQINFSAWDYDTIKESMLDYLKMYYPEDFNDFIESSELIALIETFAYAAELIAYRLDMNASENFMSVAQRKESALRLAKFLSYNPSRNIPARGLVKITTVSTSEVLFDSNNNNIANKAIRWNDATNPNWKEQFVLVLNKVFEQDFGSILPADRAQVQDVLFEVYTLNNNPLDKNVVKYSASVSGNVYPMELVPVQLNENGPFERRPEKNQQLNMMYLNDGLGDTSDNTGFFFFTKQGLLQRNVAQFDGVTPNLTYDVNVINVNQTDVWVSNIDANTGFILDDENFGDLTRSGEWAEVDLANARNVIFNTNPNRNKYEIETLANDQFRLIFGDGNFANIPSGQFEIWFRTSANADVVIPTSSIQNVSSSFTYRDPANRDQNFSFTFSLVDPIQNAAPSEDIDHIKATAGSVFSTQDRMVGGRDYNEYPLKDNTILKLRTINRTFAGDSKYITWHDASENYENVKIFGNDLVLYYKTINDVAHIPFANLPPSDGDTNVDLVNAMFFNYIQPVLNTQDWFISAVLKGVIPVNVRMSFNDQESAAIKTALRLVITSIPNTFYLTYDTAHDVWKINVSGTPPLNWSISVTANSDGSWDVSFIGHRIVVNSLGTNFWITNQNKNVITADTLKVRHDEIVILRANISSTGCSLDQNYTFNALAQEVIESEENIGLDSIHDLHVIPADLNQDGIPDNLDLTYLIKPTDFVYFSRTCPNCEWTIQPNTSDSLDAYDANLTFDGGEPIWKRESGVYGLNFLWMHFTPNYYLVDPSPTNIHDMYIITRGYYSQLRLWLIGELAQRPEPPTPLSLRNSYNDILQNKMLSDTVVAHAGKIKVIIGALADPTLQGTIKVIRTENSALTDNQLKTQIVDLVTDYFDISFWEFGETFYFPELSAFLQTKMPVDLKAVVFVPSYQNKVFGDLFQVFAREDEIIQAAITVSDIEVVQSLNPRVLKQPT
jgi:hypothetical protein